MKITFGLGIFQANTYFQNQKIFIPKIPGPYFVDKRCVEPHSQPNTRSKRTGHKTISQHHTHITQHNTINYHTTTQNITSFSTASKTSQLVPIFPRLGHERFIHERAVFSLPTARMKDLSQKSVIKNILTIFPKLYSHTSIVRIF